MKINPDILGHVIILTLGMVVASVFFRDLDKRNKPKPKRQHEKYPKSFFHPF